MPPELITGRDVELLVVGVSCVVAAGWFGVLSRTPSWEPLVVFVSVGALSLLLAVWDIRARGALSITEDG